ncbi:f-box only protein [Anaeramoeba ignava]|uniref:F-box only protein n=1 Tax=Anaeramoeba ignava TaxID=1746090 RepID=A0A9Q0LM64_ANAIG|nr:f-box only protein [Anaeramoeba ignava]
MQNQIEIEEKEIEKEIEEEKLKCANYKLIGKESFIPINQKDFQKLKKSELISTPFKTRKPSNEINLIFEMLFDEILLIILSYLSPGEIILFSLTCKQAQMICSDYFLWKQIAIKFQDYFKWDFVFFDYYYYNYPNIELKGIQFKIQEKNQNNPNQKQIEELSKTNEKIKNYFNNSKTTTIKTGTYHYQPNFISIKSERIIYIQNLQNPKQKIENKAKMIYKELKKAKQKYMRTQKNDQSNLLSNKYAHGSTKYLISEVILVMNVVILITTLIILNIYIDSKKSISIPKLFLLSKIDLIITIIWIIYSKSTFSSEKKYYNLLLIPVSLFIFMILISLKTRFNFIPWLIVLLPLIVLFISLISQLNRALKNYSMSRPLQMFLIYIFGYFVIVLFFIGLKLDGFIQIKYSKLIYLFIFDLIIFFINSSKEFSFYENLRMFLVVSFVLILQLLMLFLYGDGIIKNLEVDLFILYL